MNAEGFVENQWYQDLSEDGKKVFHKYLEINQVDCIKFHLAKGKTAIDGCKIGGEAYLPCNAVYPCKADGSPLALLCQLNLEEMPSFPKYPNKGILQFFIDPEDCFCMDGDYKVRYISNPSKDPHQIVPAPSYITPSAYLPFVSEMQITFETTTIPIPSNIDNSDIFSQAVQKACDEVGIASLSDDDMECMVGLFEGIEISGICEVPQDSNGMWIPDGYPVQLLQIISEHQDEEWIINFGDAGGVHFMLPKGALEQMQFGDVYYFTTCG